MLYLTLVLGTLGSVDKACDLAPLTELIILNP